MSSRMVRNGKSTSSVVSPFTHWNAVVFTMPLVVLSAYLNEPIQKEMVYVKIKLLGGLQVLAQTMESTKLRWNQTFELWVVPFRILGLTEFELSFSTSTQTGLIDVKLKKQCFFLPDICLGEGLVDVGYMMNCCRTCQGAIARFILNDYNGTLALQSADYSLILQSPDHKRSIGTLELRLQMKANIPQSLSRIVDSRQAVQNLNAKYSQEPDGSSSSQTTTPVGESPELDGLQALSRI